jgi:hypothetical protein
MMKRVAVLGWVWVAAMATGTASAQAAGGAWLTAPRHDATYANPMDLPYRFRPEEPSRREAADPTMITYKGEYWLFASKSGGYWHSKDLQNWTFVAPTGLPLENYAPDVQEIAGKLYYTAGSTKAIYVTDDPVKGVWTKAADLPDLSDPAFFLDDDGRLYLYSGTSSKTPINVKELDWRHGFAILQSKDLPETRDILHRGYEVDGENNDDLKAGSWIEGAWMTKHDGKYYLQYATPATAMKIYADGVLVGDSPLGPFHLPPWGPLSLKPAGFIAGAGHGSTFQALDGRWWHIASMTISVRHPFERRLGLFPVEFLPDGQVYTDTYLGDYPHRWGGDRGPAGWMLLSLNKPATATSSLDGHGPEKAVDEEVRDWWSAKTGAAGESLTVDLGSVQAVRAVQINFADEGSTTLGPGDGPYLYALEGSSDGQAWTMLVDHRAAGRDAPDDYEELPEAARARYVRITNVRSPNGAKFSLSGLRVFGEGNGPRPERVTGVAAVRSAKEPADGRVAEVSWKPAAHADFYIVRYGIAKDRLFGSYQVYGATAKEIRSLNTGVKYYFTVDAVNAAGVTKGGEPVALP